MLIQLVTARCHAYGSGLSCAVKCLPTSLWRVSHRLLQLASPLIGLGLVTAVLLPSGCKVSSGGRWVAVQASLPKSPFADSSQLAAESATETSDHIDPWASFASATPTDAPPEPQTEPAIQPVSLKGIELQDPAEEAYLEAIVGDRPLMLDEVVTSVQVSYPLLLTALLESQVADGKRLSTLGEFDLGIKAFGIAAPEGFYQTYRQGLALDQPLFGGGYVYGGYKNGDGNFQPWFKERETNEGGEFSAGVGMPLLQNRDIDKRREAFFKASLQQQAVEPFIQAQLLEFVRSASQVYWSWVAAGRVVIAQQKLLELAQARVEIIEARVRAEDLGEIARINNDQLIASRETKLIEAQRKLQQAAIKLSLFLRTEQGDPLVPSEDALPNGFPMIDPPNPSQQDADIARALDARPELRELELLERQVRVELSQANNLRLPKLDAQLLASKDVGAPTSSSGDKTPFELEFGLYGEVPYQRREARGKIVAAQGKLAQIQTKREFTANKITAEIQDAYSALRAASERIERARLNYTLAQQAQALGEEQFSVGDIDLIDLNIYEQSTTDAELVLIDASLDYFVALADYQASLASMPAPAVAGPPSVESENVD